MIVAFFGPDGAGKTTLARMLAVYLATRNYKVSYTRFKYHHLAMYLLLRLFKKLNIIPNTDSPRILDYSLRRYFGRSKLFICLETINAILWLILNIKLREAIKGNVIVAERYVPDFIVSMLLLKPSKSVLYILLKITRPFMSNAMKVYLYADPADILDRKKDESLSINYVNILMHLYQLVVKFIGADLCINTSRLNIAEAFQRIKKLVDTRVKPLVPKETKA